MIGSATISFPPVVDSTAGSTSSSGWLCACVLIVLLIGGAPAISAQCPLSDEDAPPLPPTAAELAGSSTLVGEPLLPEAGNLSDRVYTSRFFGFAIDLPIPLDGHRILIPPLQTGEHALLGIGFQNGKRSGTLTITAGGHVEVGRKATPQEKEEDFERWAQGKPPRQQREPSDAMQRSGHLNHVETHVHDIYGARYWTVIKNYTIRFTVETNDARFLKQAKQSIRAIKIYCPLDDGTLVLPDGKRFTPEGANYEGPSIPTDRVDEAISTRPADETIPPGETNGRYLSQPGIGISVRPSAGMAGTRARAVRSAQRCDRREDPVPAGCVLEDPASCGAGGRMQTPSLASLPHWCCARSTRLASRCLLRQPRATPCGRSRWANIWRCLASSAKSSRTGFSRCQAACSLSMTACFL